MPASKSTPIDAGAVGREAIDVASEKQGSDILLIDVRDLSSFTDYMVIVTAGSVRQLRALAEDLARAIQGAGLRLHHLEGTAESGWILLDFGDLVAHVFGEEQRSFYGLEHVWRDGQELFRIQ